MSLVIGTNVSALYSQNALKTNARSTATTMERLSTGVRVNNAKDDAAGLAIGQNMSSQIRGLDQAVRNINDGINLVQTAEGGLSSITDMLQRMRELAVQSANGTNSDVQRAYLQKETTALKIQISKIVDTTMWNDQKLLDGTFSKPIQIGSDVGTKMDIVIPSMDTAHLLPPSSGTTESSSIQFPPLVLGQSITVDGLTFTAKQTITGDQVAAAFGNMVPGSSSGAGVGYGEYHGSLNTFSSGASAGNQVQMTSALPFSDVTDIVISVSGFGQAAAPIVNTAQGTSATAGRTETATVKFNGLTINQSVTVGGLRFTANRTLTADEVASAFASLQSGAVTGTGTANGNYSGTLSGYSSGASANDTVIWTSTVQKANVSNLSVSVAGAPSLAGAPFVNPSNGHTYELVTSLSPIRWTQAKAAAELKTLNGEQGYLGTVTSPEENAFVVSKFGNLTAWIGASDAAQNGTWKWVTGPEAGTIFQIGNFPSVTSSPGYANWVARQPDNGYGGTEAYAGYWGSTGWNDFIDTGSSVVKNYLVEYGQVNAPIAPVPDPIAPTVSVVNGAPDDAGHTESSTLAFPTLNIGQSLMVAGLQFTATSTLTSDQVAAAFANLTDGSTTGSLNALGTYSGTLTGFHSGANNMNSLTFVSSQTDTNVADIGIILGNAVGAPNPPDIQTTQGGSTAVSSIDEIDAALDSVNSTRATLGSYINRLAYAADNVTNISSNATQSRSTIIDADYAIETTSLAKNQIIQQAATAMLAQANTQPQAVMALLKNA